MKQFTIEIKHASPAQLLTIAAELKIMSNGWTKFGPRIMINGRKLQAPSLRIPGPGHKPQASSATKKTQLKSIIKTERNKNAKI